MTTKKKIALVSGANKGIGFETVKQLANQGYFVYLGCRSKENGIDALHKIKMLGFQDIEILELDVTKPQTIENAVNEIKSKFRKLDVLINNAGILGEMPQNASDNTIENLKNIFDTNFFGAVQLSQRFLELLKKSDQPRIVNVSSDLGSLTQNSNPGYPFYEVKLLGYNSSKTALNAFTVMLSYEFKDTNFKINSINPGYTATDLNGNSGTQTAEQSAKIIVEYATLDDNGPTGRFISEYGITAW
ncbi:MAG: SDR family oxidoreductase [Ginsengibacter sp.]